MDEVAQHQHGGVEIGDHPPLQRPHHHHVADLAVEHLFGLGPDRDDAASIGAEGDD